MITSRNNSNIKLIRSLKDKKNRDNLGLYIVEGAKMVNEAIKFKMDIDKIFVTLKGKELLSNPSLVTEIIADDVYQSISEEVSPQGVLAIIKKPKIELSSPKDSCIFLDGVSDPANVGAIIRTACASNYKEIYIADGADAYSPKAVRASMSGIYNVKIYSGKKDMLLKAINLPLVIADMHGKNVFDTDIKEKFCLVIGSEAHGVSKEVRDGAKYTVSIPMDSSIESLNAGVSAGIIMYALKKHI